MKFEDEKSVFMWAVKNPTPVTVRFFRKFVVIQLISAT